MYESAWISLQFKYYITLWHIIVEQEQFFTLIEIHFFVYPTI